MPGSGPGTDGGCKAVCSLLGAATETIVRLGCADRLVGRSHECDWPPSILTIPVVSAAKIDPEADSMTIDAAVRALADLKEPVYAIAPGTLDALAPDLIIVQDHCRVCALTPSDLAAASCTARQLILKPSTLADCLDDVVRIGEALGERARGEALRGSLQARLDCVRAAVASSAASDGASPPKRRRVAVLEWCSPLMGSGYWIPELIELGGGEPVLCAPPGGRTPTFASVERVLAAAPDVVIFALCGFDLPRAARELRSAAAAGAVAELVRAGVECFVMDGNGLVNRSGPRLVESAEAIAEAIEPRLRGFFGHWGTHYLQPLAAALSAPIAGPTAAPAAAAPAVGAASAGARAQAPSAQQPAAAPPPAEGAASAAAPSSGPAATVAAQLAALACGGRAGIDAAFAFNSAANQARFDQTSARFEAALRSVEAFAALLGPQPARTTIASRAPTPLPSNGSAAVERVAVEVAVQLPGGEEVMLEWELERSLATATQGADDERAACWLTARVGFASCPA